VSITLTRAANITGLDNMGQAAAGAAGVLNLAKCGLIKADFTALDTLALADISQADFDGYALSAAITWAAAAYSLDASAPMKVGDLKAFTCTGDVTPNTIFGMFIVDNAGAVLLATEKFAAPIGVVNGVVIRCLPQVGDVTTHPVAEDNPITV